MNPEGCTPHLAGVPLTKLPILLGQRPDCPGLTTRREHKPGQIPVGQAILNHPQTYTLDVKELRYHNKINTLILKLNEETRAMAENASEQVVSETNCEPGQ